MGCFLVKLPEVCFSSAPHVSMRVRKNTIALSPIIITGNGHQMSSCKTGTKVLHKEVYSQLINSLPFPTLPTPSLSLSLILQQSAAIPSSPSSNLSYKLKLLTITNSLQLPPSLCTCAGGPRCLRVMAAAHHHTGPSIGWLHLCLATGSLASHLCAVWPCWCLWPCFASPVSPASLRQKSTQSDSPHPPPHPLLPSPLSPPTSLHHPSFICQILYLITHLHHVHPQEKAGSRGGGRAPSPSIRRRRERRGVSEAASLTSCHCHCTFLSSQRRQPISIAVAIQSAMRCLFSI